MNCGVGIAQGMLQKIENESVIAYVGDSTFFHSGIPGLITPCSRTRAWCSSSSTINGLPDRPPAQPTTDIALDGTRMRPVDIKGLLKSIGVTYVRTIRPFNIKASMAAIKEAIRVGKGVRVIIAEEECALQYGRRIARTPAEYEIYYQIDEERCQKCNECYVELGCPSIRKEETGDGWRYYIEEATCLCCGACHDLCLNSAILRTEIRRRVAGTEAV